MNSLQVTFLKFFLQCLYIHNLCRNNWSIKMCQITQAVKKQTKKINDLCIFPIFRLQKAAVSSGSSYTFTWIRCLSATPAVSPYITEPPASWPTPSWASPRICECVYVQDTRRYSVKRSFSNCSNCKTGKNGKSPAYCRNSQIFFTKVTAKDLFWVFEWHQNSQVFD